MRCNNLKVIDLETIESKEARQKIQNITDEVSRELRICRARVRVDKDKWNEIRVEAKDYNGERKTNMWIRNDDNCGIELDGLKIVDIITGDGYAGCRCSTTNDRNRYDKESKTIICCNYSNCLKDVLKRLPDYKLVEIKECLKAYAGIS